MTACLAFAALMTMPPVPDPARLRATVERLAAFNTRNTLSVGLRESCEWIAEEFRRIPGVQVELMEYTIAPGRRIPEETKAVQVIATLPGRTDRVLMMGGHIDSLNLQEADPKTGRAPGANDDASGVAASLETARLLAATGPHECTLKFIAFSGEEQGLYGATALAERAKTEGWRLEGLLNNDTVGSSRNLRGQSEPNRVRVFSEEGEQGSRELARIAAWRIRQAMPDFSAKLVMRRDRFGRGGDHTPFHRAGFPAVRFIEVYEEWAHQHTPDDTVENMDFDYLARVTQANAAVLASLASAASAPEGLRVDMRQTYDTRLTWRGQPGVRYEILWRDTGSAEWEQSRTVGPFDDGAGEALIENVNKDDHFFGVAALGGVPIILE